MVATFRSLEVSRREVFIPHILYNTNLHGLSLRPLLAFISLRRTTLLVHNLLVTLKRSRNVNYILFGCFGVALTRLYFKYLILHKTTFLEIVTADESTGSIALLHPTCVGLLFLLLWVDEGTAL